MRWSERLAFILALLLTGSLTLNLFQWHEGVVYLDKVSIVEGPPREVSVEVPGPVEYRTVSATARRHSCPSVANALNRFERMTRHGK